MTGHLINSDYAVMAHRTVTSGTPASLNRHKDMRARRAPAMRGRS